MRAAESRDGGNGFIGRVMSAQQRRGSFNIAREENVSRRAGGEHGREAEMVEAQRLRARKMRQPVGQFTGRAHVHVVYFSGSAMDGTMD